MLLERRTITSLHISSPGNWTRLTFQIYLRTELFSTQNQRFQINSHVAAARLTRGSANVIELGDERVTFVFHVHQVYLYFNDYIPYGSISCTKYINTIYVS